MFLGLALFSMLNLWFSALSDFGVSGSSRGLGVSTFGLLCREGYSLSVTLLVVAFGSALAVVLFSGAAWFLGSASFLAVSSLSGPPCGSFADHLL